MAPDNVIPLFDGSRVLGTREGDGRVVNCILTTRGGELLAERRARAEQSWQAELAEFSTQDLATAAALLDRLRALYDDLSTDPHDESCSAGARSIGDRPLPTRKGNLR